MYVFSCELSRPNFSYDALCIHITRFRGRSENWWKTYPKFKIADNTILLAESSNDLERLLMKVKEESAKAGLHLNIIKKTEVMTTKEIHNFYIDNED